VPALAQAPAGTKPLVVLTTFAKANVPEGEAQTRQELAHLGWRVGDNLRLEFRYADNQPERLDALARELVALQPTAALTTDGPSVRALLRHTKQVPMVVGSVNDPVMISNHASIAALAAHAALAFGRADPRLCAGRRPFQLRPRPDGHVATRGATGRRGAARPASRRDCLRTRELLLRADEVFG